MKSTLDDFDILIVGASIAGNYLAFLLSNLPIKVLIIEEHIEIGLPFQCAGIVSQKLNSLLDLPPNLILNRVKVAKLVTPSGSTIELSGDEQPFIIDRIALDRMFYDKSKNSPNITYSLGEKFKSFKYIIENGQKYVLIETSRRVIKVKMLVGCDGPLSLVGKQLKVKNEVLYATQIRIKSNFQENEAVMYFHPLWKQLFAWIVPEGHGIYRIGIASAKKVKQCFDIYLKMLGLNISNKIDQQGGIIPYGIMNKSAFNNILLLGDAAGQVKATTGGGIVMLLIAAKQASNCIRLSIKQKNYSKKFIKKHYEKPCLRIIGKELKLHFVIRLILERFSDKDFEIFFKIIKRNKIEHIILLYGDMDFPKDLIFKLIKNPLVFTFIIKFSIKNPDIFIKLVKILFR